ncbi:MAG: PA14 domain-containing protein [Verrucomicrobiota bacterium]
MAPTTAASSEEFTTLTNLTQLAHLPKSSQHVQWVADLEGTVLVGGNEFAVVSFDVLGQTKVIDARGSRLPLKAGQRIRYRGNLLIGEGNDLPNHWATVNNDGTHSMLSASGQAILMKGRHQVRLLYFNAGGLTGLEVYYEGPGCPRQQIPAAALSHQIIAGHETNWMPGLTCRYVQGRLPSAAAFLKGSDVRESPTAKLVPDFSLDSTLGTNQFGCDFEGFLEIPQTGLYEFTITSDDGALLFVATEPPDISVVDQSTSVALAQWVAGERWDHTNEVTGGALTGVVSFVHPGEAGLNFEVAGDNGRTIARLLKPGLLTPELLNGSRIRAAGLGRRAASPEGFEILGQLLIPSDAAVDVLNLPNRGWAMLPVKTIPELKAVATSSTGTLVRVSGALRQKQSDGRWLFTGEQGEISVELRGQDSPPEKQPMEVLLSTIPNAGGGWTALTWRQLASARDAGSGLLPVLTSIEEVKKLTRAEAQRGYPVAAHGVVTFIWPGNGFFFCRMRAGPLMYAPRIWLKIPRLEISGLSRVLRSLSSLPTFKPPTPAGSVPVCCPLRGIPRSRS